MRDHGVGHAEPADARGQRARVDAADPDDPARLQPGVEPARRAVVGGVADVGAQDAPRAPAERGEVDGLDVLLVGPDDADVRET